MVHTVEDDTGWSCVPRLAHGRHGMALDDGHAAAPLLVMFQRARLTYATAGNSH